MRRRPSFTRETVTIAVAMCVIATIVVVAPGIAVIASLAVVVVIGAVLIVPWVGRLIGKSGATREEKSKPSDIKSDKD